MRKSAQPWPEPPVPLEHFFVLLVCQLHRSKIFFFSKKIGHIDSSESTGNFCRGWETPSYSASAFPWMQVADGGMESWQSDPKSSPLISIGLRASLLPLTSCLLGVVCFKDGFSLPLSLGHSKHCPNHCWQNCTEMFFSKDTFRFFWPMSRTKVLDFSEAWATESQQGGESCARNKMVGLKGERDLCMRLEGCKTNED